MIDGFEGTHTTSIQKRVVVKPERQNNEVGLHDACFLGACSNRGYSWSGLRLMEDISTMIYLAIPYTGEEDAAYRFANRYAGMLMQEGHLVFSPISMCHSIAQVAKLPTDFEYWRRFNIHMLDLCDVLVVLMFDGWKESVGVTAEIEYATKIGMPILYRFFTDQPSGIEVTDRQEETF